MGSLNEMDRASVYFHRVVGAWNNLSGLMVEAGKGVTFKRFLDWHRDMELVQVEISLTS